MGSWGLIGAAAPLSARPSVPHGAAAPPRVGLFVGTEESALGGEGGSQKNVLGGKEDKNKEKSSSS